MERSTRANSPELGNDSRARMLNVSNAAVWAISWWNASESEWNDGNIKCGIVPKVFYEESVVPQVDRDASENDGNNETGNRTEQISPALDNHEPAFLATASLLVAILE
jgi:hypothetical protein